jgi:signal transduction histidine kinase
LAEIIYDEVGLKPSDDFFGLIHSSSLWKAKRFLHTAVASHSALDWELDVELADGIVPLFFSASMTSRGIVIIGMKDAVVSAPIPKGLLQRASTNPDSLGPALKDLHFRKQSKARAQRRLRRELSRISNASTAWQKASDSAKLKAERGGQTRLIRMLAHDLRNSISGILAASQYLIEDAAPLVDSQHVTLLRSIESSSGLLLRLIEDVLEIPWAGSGTPKFHFQWTDVTRLVDHSAAIHRPLAQARDTRLDVRKDDAVPRLLLDPVKMTHALNALLTNAIRSSPPGSNVEIGIVTRPESVVITVSHTGPADAAQNQNADRGPRTRRVHGVSALTLSSVRRIVEGHGGAVRMDNRARRDTFTLTLSRVRRRKVQPQDARPRRGAGIMKAPQNA